MSKLTPKRRYKKPAIREAVFEAKFDVTGFDITTPGQIFDQIKSEYPIKQEIKHEIFYLENRGISSTEENKPLIQAPQVRARKIDNSELLQFGPGIITANRLSYTSWEEFKPAIELVSKAYINAAHPLTLTRVATRYINSFLLPEDTAQVKDYFTITLDAPDNLLPLDGFNVTIAKSITNEYIFNLKIRLYTTALNLNEQGNKFILDIECHTLLKEKPDTNDIVNLANKNHEILSEAFESIITDKTRDLMEVLT